MDETSLNRDPDQLRPLLDLVLETAQMNAAMVDTDLRHTWVRNSSPEPPEAEIIGKTDAELFSDQMAEPTMAIKRDAIETESRIEREFTFIKPWGQNRYRAAAEPLYEDGAVEGAMFAAIDISDRYRMLQRTTDAVYTVDADWVVTFWDERMADRTGTPPEDVVGRNLWDVFGDSLPDELQERYRTVMRTGEPAEFELYLPEPFDLWVEIRVFADDDGLSVYSRDITERKEDEARLKDQRDTLDLLTHVLSHDIRNDLQIVTAYAELLADEVDAEARTDLETIRESANHAYDLTTTATEISQVVFSEDQQLRRISLGTVLLDEIESIRTEYPDAAVLVDDRIRDVTVLADEMLGSLFRNLLKNAIQHNDEAVAEVRVTCEQRPDTVVVNIADNGPGVPDAAKQTIFEKGETGLASEGSGIGLALVSMLVERYDGSVRVTDNDPDGTVFAVTLPAVETDRSSE